MSLGEMNALLSGLLVRLNAKGLRRAPGQSRVTLFEQLDRPALRPLRMEPFAFFEVDVTPVSHPAITRVLG
jgi:hypothetical protein